MTEKEFMKYVNKSYKLHVKLEKLLKKLNVTALDKAIICSIAKIDRIVGEDMTAQTVEEIYKERINRIPKNEQDIEDLATMLLANIENEADSKKMSSKKLAILKTLNWVNKQLERI